MVVFTVLLIDFTISIGDAMRCNIATYQKEEEIAKL